MRTAECNVCFEDVQVVDMAPTYASLATHDDADGVFCAGSGRSVPAGAVHDLILDAGVQ